MIRSKTLGAAAAGGALLLTTLVSISTTASADTTAAATVSGPVQLADGCSPRNGNSPHASVDPADPSHVSVVYTAGDSVAGVVATTRDGGRTWSRAPLPGMTTCTGGPDGFIGDPMIATGAGGKVMATEGWVTKDPNLGLDHDALRVFLTRSNDGGATFFPPNEPDPMQPDQRAPLAFAPGPNGDVFVAVERLHYLNADTASTFLLGPGEILVTRSSDGASWSQHDTAIAAGPTLDAELFTIGLEHTGSALVLIYAAVDHTAELGEPLPEVLWSTASTDAGQTWSAPQQIGTYHYPKTDATGCCIPDASVAPDGTLFVAWPSDDRHSVTIADSVDNGATWSRHDTIVTTRDVVQPAIAARSAQRVGLLFYEHATGPIAGDEYLIPRLASSHDAGSTWHVTTPSAAFDLTTIQGGNSDREPIGPYQDLLARPDGYAAVVTLADGHGGEDVHWFDVSD